MGTIIIRLHHSLLKMVGGTIPIKPIGLPANRQNLAGAWFRWRQNEGMPGTLTLGATIYVLPQRAVCETYSFNVTHQLIILPSVFLFSTKLVLLLLFVCLYACIYICYVLYIYTFIVHMLDSLCLRVLMFVCLCVCAPVCVYVCVCVSVINTQQMVQSGHSSSSQGKKVRRCTERHSRQKNWAEKGSENISPHSWPIHRVTNLKWDLQQITL